MHLKMQHTPDLSIFRLHQGRARQQDAQSNAFHTDLNYIHHGVLIEKAIETLYMHLRKIKDI